MKPIQSNLAIFPPSWDIEYISVLFFLNKAKFNKIQNYYFTVVIDYNVKTLLSSVFGQRITTSPTSFFYFSVFPGVLCPPTGRQN